jgi:hypothetical protein
VTFTAPADAEVSIVYNEKIAESKNSVVIPSDSLSFKSWAKKSRLDYVTKPGKLIFIAATEHTALSITPKTRYCFDLPERSTFDDDTSTDMEPKEDTVVLKLDVVQEFNSLMDETLNRSSQNSIDYSLNYRTLRLGT